MELSRPTRKRVCAPTVPAPSCAYQRDRRCDAGHCRWTAVRSRPTLCTHRMSKARPRMPSDETRVMIGMSWVFLVLGTIAMICFVRDPSIVRHPQLALFGTTALVGVGIL